MTDYNLQGKINLIKDAKDDIKEAIEDKISDSIGTEYTISGNITTYANEINKIVTPNNETLPTIIKNGTYRYNNTIYTGYNDITVNVSRTGEYLVQVIDYDGTVLKAEQLNTNETFELPSNPSHTGLIFQEWSSPVTITDGKVIVEDSDITIGATYTTASGLSEFDITLTPVTGLTITFNMDGTKNWGDGTNDTNTSHTYSDYGDYTITCDGTTMTIASYSCLFGEQSDICTSVKFANITTIVDYAFKGCTNVATITIPNSVTNIGEYALSDCSALKSITIPNGVTCVNDSMCDGCQTLLNIAIPKGVTSIGSSGISNCYLLTNITIPNTVTSLGSYALGGNISLKSIKIPNSVTSIGSTTFSRCQSLVNIVLPDEIIDWGLRTFEYCYNLTNIILPNGITSIGNETFRECEMLKSIIIPDGVISIGERVFYFCDCLTSITISDDVTSIGEYAFYGCGSLGKIYIPNGVSEIKANTFKSCVLMMEYDFTKHTSIPTLLNKNAFEGINSFCKIKVPASLESAWKEASNWVTYADYIVGV